MSQLSKNDQFVLFCLFPKEKIEKVEKESPQVICAHLDGGLHYSIDQGNLSNAQRREIEIIQGLESKSINYKKALEEMDALIEQNSEYASAYNNRAQLKRLLYLEKKESGSEITVSLDSIDTDLGRAIDLAQKDIQKTNGPHTYLARHVAAQAYTQKGWVVLTRIQVARATKSSHEENHNDITVIGKDDSWELEEEASRWLHLGGEYGNEYAQRAAALVNPYAKLCGQMVERALHHEYKY
ncbi:uncharacterized protein SAPINGB_P004989 [Magnusiomyces paraingens]|uniref:Uncharacterized protein n=1 Tax=Magnusiomyces paraingens TaxID=2606893 RepID=A0A5E8C0D9_9ASCO|nr:uncharacterized protein SAPINGB_P004989 [Saprochaete ingens]VVT56345.1 unnamed protein product [Saprochaete ingens]